MAKLNILFFLVIVYYVTQNALVSSLQTNKQILRKIEKKLMENRKRISQLESELKEAKAESESSVYFNIRNPKKTNSSTPLFKYATGNAGGHYNTKNGYFKAPVKGLYHFYLSFMIEKELVPSDTYVYCWLCTRSHPSYETIYHTIAAAISSNAYQSASASIYIELEKGDQFYPKCGNWYMVYLGPNSQLSGALVQPL